MIALMSSLLDLFFFECSSRLTSTKIVSCHRLLFLQCNVDADAVCTSRTLQTSTPPAGHFSRVLIQTT